MIFFPLVSAGPALSVCRRLECWLQIKHVLNVVLKLVDIVLFVLVLCYPAHANTLLL